MQSADYTIRWIELHPVRVRAVLSFLVFFLLINLTTISVWTGSQRTVDQIAHTTSTSLSSVEPLQASVPNELGTLAKVEQKAPEPPKPVYTALPDNQYKAFIYQKESGNNPAAVNSIGCRGLGQACPGSKLPCGNDYACQDAYFTNYAIGRYGSWAGAYNFWVTHSWW